ncbi:hypothetical protein IQ238_12040 [Pleurocapsales cyanobacterium LEGE 06147]|nr:hypothetical protein [Pleurocapsales cyanobacterium LEGE 06147]
MATKAEISRSDAFSQVGSGLQSLIPPVAGLLTSSWLDMQGWKAIATYLVTSGVTREVIEQLPLELGTMTETENAQTKIRTGESASFRIVHTTPERIRLRVPRIIWDCDYARKLEDLIASHDKISKVRVNRPTGSVVINYHANAFSNNELASQNRKILANIFEVLNSTEAIEALEPLNNEPKQNIDSMSKVWEQNRKAEKVFPAEEAELIEQEMTETNRSRQAPEDFIVQMDAAQVGLWSRLKSRMLSMMLKLMANLPVQQPAKV